MIDNIQPLLIIVVCSLVTIALRALPFIMFRHKESPKYITYLGDVLPFAIMVMLVVYCLKEVDLSASPFGIPEIAASLFVIAIHLWRRNTLLSVIGGTILYMLLLSHPIS